MPTTQQIEAAPATLSATAVAQWLVLIRASAAYKEETGLYPNLAAKLAAVTAIQARQLNAALTLIDEIGDGTVKLTGGPDAVDYSQDRDRDWLINYGISVLYDQPVRASSVQVGRLGSTCSRCYSSPCGCRRLGW